MSDSADAPLSLAKRLLPATFWSIVAGGWFFLLYGLCNAHAASRAAAGDVIPTFFFEWERYIPVWPAFIVPYWSVDLLFAFSPLLCQTRRAMRRHAARLMLAIAIASLFFWFTPLQYGWERPKPEGIFRPLFDALHAMDAPYNLAPSLHIALRSLLWVIYIPAISNRWLRAATQIWFVSIGVSTLVVGQHHVIDIITGQFLALLVLHWIPLQTPTPIGSNRSVRLCALYGVGAAACAVAGAATDRIGLIFVWPFLACALVSGAYLGGNPHVYRKHHGRLPASARWLLAPVLAGKWLSWRFSRTASPYDRVTPTLLVGRRLTIDEAAKLDADGVRSVIDVTAECSTQPRTLQRDYINVPVLDLVPPSVEQLRAIADHYLAAREAGASTLVHCRLGFSRSACAAAACLLASGEAASVDEAVARVAGARERVVLRASHRAVLAAFAQTLNHGHSSS